jgi:hypothetical protein
VSTPPVWTPPWKIPTAPPIDPGPGGGGTGTPPVDPGTEGSGTGPGGTGTGTTTAPKM